MSKKRSSTKGPNKTQEEKTRAKEGRKEEIRKKEARTEEAFQAEFEKEMEKVLLQEAASFQKALAGNAEGRALRINTLRTTPLDETQKEAFASLLLPFHDVVPWEENGRYVPVGWKSGQDIFHAMGAYYMQEASAMAPVQALDVQKGERILDLCASPGGKSGQIAQRLQGEGLLVSNEIVPKRAYILKENLTRLGVTNALLCSETPQRLAAHFGAWFDRVLVDAPCSGEGMFRSHPETKAEWQKDSPARCALRQAEILESAAKLVKGGGVLVYSTCTFSLEENEECIRSFLKNHPDFVLDPNLQLCGVPGQGFLRLMPHKVRGEGQFVARLQKKGKEENFLPPLPTVSSPEWEAFTGGRQKDVYPWQDFLFLPPQGCPAIDKLHVLGLGVLLGKVEKQTAKNAKSAMESRRFLPSHELAVSNLPCLSELPLSFPEAQAFLRGETLSYAGDEKGFVRLTYMGFPVGLGKVTEGRIQNHLPKSLRLREATHL